MFAQSVVLIVPLYFASLAATQTIQFDGRVPGNTKLTDFDSANDLFGSDSVLGEGLKFSDLLLLPDVAASLFDDNTVPIEVTISDDSIFNGQTGFRRAELNPASNDGTDPSTQGVKTVHFSLMKDSTRSLNLSHEYQLFFLESNDFSTNQVVLKTGTILGQATADPDTLMFFGNVNDGNLLFSTAFTEDVFHNFGVTLDFDQNTAQVFHSTGSDDLKAVTDVLDNDNSGQGLFHFGLLKKGVNGGADITKDAEQPAGINEGIIFGGIFEEDSSKSKATLAP
ncbi:hypothetical protein N0V93_002735 [Gnomoniopsis smithogilvyi]|uniref:Glycoside hydrolase 131 catalytic N-terminal domain-containing protein n=1 Tax=Gnomoniopsis smithogilvyi TaxID=1191159 RepID=A0A9W9CZC2_9PEZI|nr:hypothetical protein N0V93_002735 [Gnomoniopsis smithogilvyi]